jgi:hypothetical protein
LQQVLRSVAGGVGGFAIAWVAPTALAVSAYWFVLVDQFESLTAGASGQSTFPELLRNAAMLALIVFVLAAALAYASLPLYRVLEGYLGPKPLLRFLRRRSLREWKRLQRVAHTYRATQRVENPQDLDRVLEYPVNREDVLPTRLGNALRAMEDYGRSRFDLDSQLLWYELLMAVPKESTALVEQARRSVDFFIGGIAALLALVVATVVTVVVDHSLLTEGAILVSVAIALIPLAYLGAVANTVDWGHAVKALVNTGRVPLAQALSLEPESTDLEGERRMWRAFDLSIGRLYADQVGNLNYVRRWPGVQARVYPGLPDVVPDASDASHE